MFFFVNNVAVFSASCNCHASLSMVSQQLFETCSVAEVLPAILGLEDAWYKLVPESSPDEVWDGATKLLVTM